jgi:hypothetical protein
MPKELTAKQLAELEDRSKSEQLSVLDVQDLFRTIKSMRNIQKSYEHSEGQRKK